MKIYFYHTQDMAYCRGRMAAGEFPPHYLYGASLLPAHGVEVVWHRSCPYGTARWRQSVVNTWRVLRQGRHIDAVYATHYRGLELLVLLRALGVFRRPIVVWHHQPVVRPRQWWREALGRLFYRGMDRMIFFSQSLIDASLASPKVRRERVVLGHWGADLPFYDKVAREAAEAADSAGRQQPLLPTPCSLHPVFISTGKEMRDMPTLVRAFNAVGARLDIYVNAKNGAVDYRQIFGAIAVAENVRLHWVRGLEPHALALAVAAADCVCVCCQETKYTVGLTTVVEALALGKPLLCSRNRAMPVDVEREGCGLAIDYGDTEGWQRAIAYIQRHPDEARAMGQRGRRLAERLYNNRRCAEEVAQVLRQVTGGGGTPA